MLIYVGVNAGLANEINQYNVLERHFNNPRIRAEFKKAQFGNYEDCLVRVIEQTSIIDRQWYDANKLQLLEALKALRTTCELIDGIKLKRATENHLHRLQREIYWVKHQVSEVQDGICDAIAGPIKMVFHPIETAKGVASALWHPMQTARAIRGILYQRPVYSTANMTTSFFVGKAIKFCVNKQLDSKVAAAAKATEQTEKIAATDTLANAAQLSKEATEAAEVASKASETFNGIVHKGANVAKSAGDISRLEMMHAQTFSVATSQTIEILKLKVQAAQAAQAADLSQKAGQMLQSTTEHALQARRLAESIVSASKAAEAVVVEEVKSINAAMNVAVKATQVTGQGSHLTLLGSKKSAEITEKNAVFPEMNDEEKAFVAYGESISPLMGVSQDKKNKNPEEEEFMQYAASLTK